MPFCKRIILTICVLLNQKPCSCSHAIRPMRSHARALPLRRKISQESTNSIVLLSTRGGGDNSEERYSRQYYTLGARAHGLIRSSTVYIDGPSYSGLVYECGKNLALSGIGHIVVLTSDNDLDTAYHEKELDDLGQAYVRAALSELEYEDDTNVSKSDILVEYLQRLNPSVDVSKKSRSDLRSQTSFEEGLILCIDRPFSTQVELNNCGRKHNLKFVAVETAGLFGKAFCDFGDNFQVFDKDGETPFVVPLDRVELTDDFDLMVCSVEGERHDVSKGDQIVFQLSNGEAMESSFTVVMVQSPERFLVKPDISSSLADVVERLNTHASSFARVKVPETLSFLPLTEAIERWQGDDSIFVPSDLDKSFDPVRRSASMCSFLSMQSFVEENRSLPGKTDKSEFLALVRKKADKDLVHVREWKSIVKSFAAGCKAKITPVQCLFGAIGAQEALKGATGLYNPAKQFLLYDCDELLIQERGYSGSEATCSVHDPSPGQSYVLGKSLTDRLATQRLFVVGAGAIGCEILKNLAAMGGGTGKGCIMITDMDTIERSNLSRQLLFRDSDIGKFKSKSAQESLSRFNPTMAIEVHTSRVGDEDHGPFNDEFWSERLDVVLNALDNIEARLYIDGQCVSHQKALIDAGTLGPKGNVQVVIPGQSESYGSSADPPEPAIPVCTLKNFPYSITHTIQWGRDLFDGFYNSRPSKANEYASTFFSTSCEEFAKHLVERLGTDAALEVAKDLSEDLGSAVHIGERSSREASIQWAVQTAKRLFYDSVNDLLIQHPEDSVDEDGEPFWSGTRRVPKVLAFTEDGDPQQNLVNQNLIEFVKSGARLRHEMYNVKDEFVVSTEDAVLALEDINWQSEDTSQSNDDVIRRIKDMIKSSAGEKHLAIEKLRVTEFEKDDETNGHVAFVTAASNLRALCYGIAPEGVMETRRVAGNIVPAMITTTAFVSAISGIELLKLLNFSPHHRNAFVNLAINFFAFTAPLPAEEMHGVGGQTFTLWDRININEGHKSFAAGGISLRRLLRRIRKAATQNREAIAISSISYGPYLVYADFLHGEDEDMLDRPFLDLLRESILSGEEFSEEFSRKTSTDRSLPSKEIENLNKAGFVDLAVVVHEQETGEDADIPTVRLVKWKDR